MRETEISNLKSKIEKLNSANFELKKTISGFEREHETMKAKITSLERQNNHYHENVQVLHPHFTPASPQSCPHFTVNFYPDPSEKSRSRNNQNRS